MRKLISIASILCTTAIFTGCVGEPRADDPVGSTTCRAQGIDCTGDDSSALADMINGVESLPVSPQKAMEEVSSETTTEVDKAKSGNDGYFECTYTTYSGTTQYQNLVSFDPQSDVLWPGSLVQGKSLTQGLLSPIGLARAPGKITISNIDVSGGVPDQDKYSRVMEDPSQASVQEAITDILSSADEVNFSAKVDYTVDRVYSLSEAAYSAGLSVEWMSGDVKAKFDKTSWTENTNIMVKLTQAYYTVSFETPSSPTSVFAPSVTAADAVPYMGEGNPPGYISSVVYGRMLLFRIESSESEETLKIALNAALKAFGGKVEGDLTIEQKKVLDESKFTLFALGGSAEDVIDIATNGAESLKGYLVNGANFSPQSPGVPISYTVRQLSDNQAVKVAYATDYSIPDCKAKTDMITIFLNEVYFHRNGDLWGEGENEYKVWVNDGFAEHIMAHEHVNASDDEPFNEDKTLTIHVPQEKGAKVEVGFWAKDTGSTDEYVTAARVHYFDFPSATWSDAASGLKLQDKDGRLDVNITYDFTVNK